CCWRYRSSIDAPLVGGTNPATSGEAVDDRRYMLNAVAIATTKTIALTKPASCGNDSRQLRFIKRNHQPASRGVCDRAGELFSASSRLLIRNHIARSFGVGSY